MRFEILLLILTAAIARADEGARVAVNCEAQKAFLAASTRAKTSLSDAVERAVQSNAKLVVFGEAHANNSDRFYDWVIRRMKARDARFDCLFVEQPKTKYESALEACRRSPSCDRSHLPAFFGVEPGLANGLKVFAVDAVPDMNAPNFLDDVTRRNRAMADESARLFKDKQCRRAIMVVGALHVHRDPRITSLPELLNERRLANYRIELVNPALDPLGHPDSRWIWRTSQGNGLCPETPRTLAANFAFVHGAEAKQVASYYGPYSDPFRGPSEFVGTWGDFDAAIMLGCADPEAARCDSVALEPRPRTFQ